MHWDYVKWIYKCNKKYLVNHKQTHWCLKLIYEHKIISDVSHTGNIFCQVPMPTCFNHVFVTWLQWIHLNMALNDPRHDMFCLFRIVMDICQHLQFSGFWKHRIDAERNLCRNFVEFRSELSLKPDWWPKQSPIFYFILSIFSDSRIHLFSQVILVI